jgi:hypothetical protein
MNKRYMFIIKVPALLALMLVMAGCGQRQNPSALEVTAATTHASAPSKSSKLRYSLGIVGYNYTEVGIYDYTINGRSGFNLGGSNERSGGGSTVCCYEWVPPTKLPITLRIEWTRDGETWCSKTVPFNGRAALEPNTLEVHFYPNRQIEVAITDEYSPPRLQIPSAGPDYRIGIDVRAEKANAIRKDREAAECRLGERTTGSAHEQQRTRS